MILADSSEPANIIALIRQSAEVVVSPLNQSHMSDYFFASHEGKRYQFSRKQAGELIGNIDEAEDQLRDYYEQADVNCQIVEGIISPVRLRGIKAKAHTAPSTTTRDLSASMYCYKVEANGYIEHGHSFSSVPSSMLYAWLHRLEEAGIHTYCTINWVETAKLVVAIYRNEQKPLDEHSTLQRIIRPRIFIKDQDPFVKAIMFLSQAYKLDIGEKKATILADKFVNIIDLAIADVDDITECAGIGKKVAKRLLSALGRDIK